ncbi:MAG: T9SS type A sorting domain-containing protein, partial [Ignavibacteria bacterium]
GSFNNATRVKHIITTRDSSILFVINTTITTYSWYVPGKKFPIFEIGFISSVQGGANTLFKTVSYTPSGPSVGISNVNTTYPDKFTLQQNYPNPFNPATSINYIIQIPGFVMLKVYDAAGKEIEILVNKKQTAGSYDIRWSGEKFNSGIYFYKLESNGNSETKKMILLK